MARNHRLARNAWLAAALLPLLPAGCVLPSSQDHTGEIPVGALLPFTGDVAASGTNIERAQILAFENINRAGGVAHKSLWLDARDTHSQTRRGLEMARELLDVPGLQALLGPEEEDLALSLVPLIKDKQVVQITGGVTSPVFSTVDDDRFWYRTCPSSSVYAAALAARMKQDGIARAGILYVNDEYGSGFSSTLTNALTGQAIPFSNPVSFEPDQATYVEVIKQVLAAEPDGLILVAYPYSGAAIIQEWAVAGGNGRWYLAPTLKNEMFIANCPTGALQGAVGVAPVLPADAPAFAGRFAERWSGDLPLDAAYFSYDAAAILALAYAAAAHGAGGVPDGLQIRDTILQVSNPPGEQIGWDELPQGLELIGQGADIDYNGASGSVDLDGWGDLDSSQVETWTIRDDAIESEGP